MEDITNSSEDKYDLDTVGEGDEILDNKVDINPELFIHKAVLASQQALLKEDMRSGLMQYRMLVEHVELISRAARIVNTDEYEKELKKFKESEEYTNERDDLIRHAKLANIKLKLLLTDVFNKNTSNAPLKA